MTSKHLYDVVYELDSRIKVIWLISCTSVYFTNNVLLILIVTFISILMFFFSGAHRSIYMKSFKYILLFFCALYLLAVWESNEPSNIAFALIAITKWFSIALSSIAFFVMTRPFELMYVLKSFKVPEGFVFALGIGFRFIPIIFEESDKILMAQKARGLYSGKGIGRILRIPTIINAITVPLIIEMLNRLWNMWLVLMVRGFAFGKKRQTIRLKLSAPNLIVLTYSIAIIFIQFVVFIL